MRTLLRGNVPPLEEGDDFDIAAFNRGLKNIERDTKRVRSDMRVTLAMAELTLNAVDETNKIIDSVDINSQEKAVLAEKIYVYEIHTKQVKELCKFRIITLRIGLLLNNLKSTGITIDNYAHDVRCDPYIEPSIVVGFREWLEPPTMDSEASNIMVRETSFSNVNSGLRVKIVGRFMYPPKNGKSLLGEPSILFATDEGSTGWIAYGEKPNDVEFKVWEEVVDLTGIGELLGVWEELETGAISKKNSYSY